MRYNELLESEKVKGILPSAISRDPFQNIIEEPGYLYHGTAKARIPYIKRDGLVPSTKSRWSKDPFIGDWSIGKVFFTSSPLEMTS